MSDKPKFYRPPFDWCVYLWEDAYTDDAWRDEDEHTPPHLHDQVVQSEGYRVQENDHYVVLAPNVSWNPETKTWSTMGRCVVTKRMVLDFKVTRRAPGSRKKKEAPKEPPAV